MRTTELAIVGAVVWGVPEAKTLAFTHAGTADRPRADVIIVAAGATDRAVPFPGWTLPGVITAGGAQNLLKSQGVFPGQRVIVAGTGPLLLVVADSLRRAGATVLAPHPSYHVDSTALGTLDSPAVASSVSRSFSVDVRRRQIVT